MAIERGNKAWSQKQTVKMKEKHWNKFNQKSHTKNGRKLIETENRLEKPSKRKKKVANRAKKKENLKKIEWIDVEKNPIEQAKKRNERKYNENGKG